ncbi:hypothetical protein IJT10_08920 [bacterium]|nr:hypothetical protein [bacterium]
MFTDIRLKINAVVVLVSILFMSWLAAPVSSQIPTVEVGEVLQKLKERTFSVRDYEADLHLVIQDPNFLKEFFWRPDLGNNKYSVHSSSHGMLRTRNSASNLEILIKYDALDYQTFSVDSDSASYLGLYRLKSLNDRTNLTKLEYEGNPDKSQIDSKTDGSNNTAEDSVKTTNVNSIQPEPYMDLKPKDSVQVYHHPLSFLLPANFQLGSPNLTIKILNSKLNFMGRRCILLGAKDPDTQDTMNVWVDYKRNIILQIETFEKKTNRTITATYLSHNPEDKDTHFILYSRVQVSCNGNPVFLGELSNPKINSLAKKALKESKEKAEKNGQKYARNDDFPDIMDIKVLGDTAKNVVKVLCIALLILGIRFILFKTSRQEFSNDLIVVDEEDGRFAEMLSTMGYKTTPFTPQVLAQERENLEKGTGSTKDTANRPRAVVVAPDSFQFIHNYLYLIKAYVEEGGRVLVMYHPQSSIKDLPYTVDLFPMQSQGRFFESRSDILTNVKPDAITRLSQEYTGSEVILKVNGKKFTENLIWSTGNQTKIQSTIVGMSRSGRGEYILCQIMFSPKTTLKNPNLQFLLNDIFRYLLGLEPIKTDNN